MTLELHALFEIHRNQILFNALDSDGNFQLSPAYIFAVDRRIYPFFHDNWCGDKPDPYSDCYCVSKDFMDDVFSHLDSLWQDSPDDVPTFYELESQYGREKRGELIVTLHYSFVSERFGEPFYSKLLSPGDHPVEAGGITNEFSPENVHLF